MSRGVEVRGSEHPCLRTLRRLVCARPLASRAPSVLLPGDAQVEMQAAPGACPKIRALTLVSKRTCSFLVMTVPRTRNRSNVLAAVDVDLGAVHIRARVGAQHVNDLRHFVGRAETLERDLLDDLVGAG
jgi:hypothetical protein